MRGALGDLGAEIDDDQTLDDGDERVNDVLLAAFERLVEKAGAETAHMWCEVLKRLKRVLDAEEETARSKIPN